MTKIMLVEDDKSLREIYGVRLLAEGYDIVSAGDGEEALAMAIKERPQLIISDVMMPKISGFDLLDILRSTTETKNIRVIMMTALSSEDQRQRGEQLGADRYLVKSQVGIEDVVRVVHEVLDDQPAAAGAPATASAAPAPAAPPAAPAPPVTTPVPPQPVPPPTPPAVPTPPPVAPPTVPPAASAPPVVPVVPSPLPVPPVAPPAPVKPPQARSKVITPLNDPSVSQININELLDKEIAKEAGLSLDTTPIVPASTSEEKAQIAQKIEEFQPMSLPEPTPIGSIPTVSVDASGIIGGTSVGQVDGVMPMSVPIDAPPVADTATDSTTVADSTSDTPPVADTSPVTSSSPVADTTASTPPEAPTA